jgi:hypothetical protein
VPLPLRICIFAAIAVLLVDAYYWFIDIEGPWNWFVPAMDIASIALFGSVHLRRPWIRKWVREISLVWGVFGCAVPFLDSLELMDGTMSSMTTVVVGVVLLATFAVLFLPSSKAYFRIPAPNTSLERTRGR